MMIGSDLPEEDDLEDWEVDPDAWSDVTGPRDVVAALRAVAAPEGPGEAGLLASMSALSRFEIDEWHAAWTALDDAARRRVARLMLEGSETNVQLDFGLAFRRLLDDEDAEVRVLAIGGLWESTDPRLARRFIALLEDDEHAEVRAQAAEGLGTFVELGELEAQAEAMGRAALASLLRAAGDPEEPEDVRRRAIASAGFADDDAVRDLLRASLESDALPLRLGAMRGIANSADQDWEVTVIEALDDPLPEIRFEAAHAAGELELESAVPRLGQLAAGDDAEIRREAIWALGEIGGQAARAILERALRTTRDPVEREGIEDALAMLSLVEGEGLPVPRSLLSQDEDDDDDLSDLDDLDDLFGPADDDDDDDDLDAADWRGAIEDALDDDAR